MIRRYVCWGDGVERRFNRHELDYPEPKRAQRRRHLLRIKAKARRIIALWMSDVWMTEEEIQHHVCQLANNRKPCSCFACGNQRKWHGPTMQEIRQNTKEKANGD